MLLVVEFFLSQLAVHIQTRLTESPQRQVDDLMWYTRIGEAAFIEPGRWYCVERHMKLNSVNPVKADGMEELWIDGELSVRQEGLRFRKVPQLKINLFSLENYYHGLPEEYTRENPMRVYFDNVVIARKYIGPMGPAGKGGEASADKNK